VTRTIIVVLAAELTAVIPPRNLVGETQTCRQQCESDPFLNTSRKTRGRTSTRPCPIFTYCPTSILLLPTIPVAGEQITVWLKFSSAWASWSSRCANWALATFVSVLPNYSLI